MDDNKAKALSAALAQIEKQFGKGSIMKMGEGCVEPLAQALPREPQIPARSSATSNASAVQPGKAMFNVLGRRGAPIPLINTGAATALDLETLGETVRRRVLENSAIQLEWEIKRIGRFAEGQTRPASIDDRRAGA